MGQETKQLSNFFFVELNFTSKKLNNLKENKRNFNESMNRGRDLKSFESKIFERAIKQLRCKRNVSFKFILTINLYFLISFLILL